MNTLTKSRIYKKNTSVQRFLPRIAEAIQRAKPEEQRQLLAQLPHLLNLGVADVALLKIAEPSFTFWNNLDDIVYDDL